VSDFDRRGLKIPEEEIETAMAGDNSPAENKEVYRRRIILAKMRIQALANLPKPTDEEISAYYRAHPKEFWEQERVKLLRASVNKKPATDEGGVEFGVEAARQEATAVRARLLARKRDAPETWRDPGGTWYDISALRPEIARAATLLNVSETSDVIESANEFFIIRVLDKQPAGQRPLEDVAEIIQKNLLSKRRVAAEEHWYADLRSHADIRKFPLPEDL
jgi:hypothetical protein